VLEGLQLRPVRLPFVHGDHDCHPDVLHQTSLRALLPPPTRAGDERGREYQLIWVGAAQTKSEPFHWCLEMIAGVLIPFV
jgi:hypothetical protein